MEPVRPGASNVIKVRYTTRRVGPFTKYATDVTLTSNERANRRLGLAVSGVVPGVVIAPPP